jgi:transcriptional regulator with XRE-family HTH domain
MFPKSTQKTDELVEHLRAYLANSPRGTAAALAKDLGVTRNRISKWTGGEIRPGLEHGLRLQEILSKTKRRGGAKRSSKP